MGWLQRGLARLGLVGISLGCVASGAKDGPDLGVRFEAAERALEAREWDLAAERYHALWLEDGGSADSVAGWARALLGADRPQSALAVLLPARDRSDSAELASLSGQALQLMDRPVGAREAFARALALDSERFDALEGLGLSLAGSGDLAGAAPLLLRAARQRPPVHARRASELAASAGLEDIELEALWILAGAGSARTDELIRGAELLAGDAGASPTQSAQAEAWLSQALEIDPQAAAAWTALGRLRAARGAAGLAVTAHERAVMADPAAVDSLLALAAYCMESGREERARALVEHALGFVIDPAVRRSFEELLEESEPDETVPGGDASSSPGEGS